MIPVKHQPYGDSFAVNRDTLTEQKDDEIYPDGKAPSFYKVSIAVLTFPGYGRELEGRSGRTSNCQLLRRLSNILFVHLLLNHAHSDRGFHQRRVVCLF